MAVEMAKRMIELGVQFAAWGLGSTTMAAGLWRRNPRRAYTGAVIKVAGENAATLGTGIEVAGVAIQVANGRPRQAIGTIGSVALDRVAGIADEIAPAASKGLS
jgi:hypothetical protein